MIDLDSVYELKPEHIAFYRENGYVKLKDVLSAATIAHFKDEIARKVQELNTQRVPLEKRTVYDKAFLQIWNLWKHSEIVRDLVMSQRLGRIAARLMGTRGVRLYHDQALYKEPRGGITPWHADQYYWPVSNDNTVTAWIPLQATPLEMGPLAFAPGSYKIEAGRDLEIGEESENLVKLTLRDFPVHESAFDLGEVSFHSGWTFHRAGENKTDRFREVMTIIYIDEDMRLAEPKNKNQIIDREKWCPGVEAGQLFASKLNPVVYSETQNF
jgi:ectoine hydroxylase-related dioxygenase (phytanoyl-CoA dioxygenase family)